MSFNCVQSRFTFYVFVLALVLLASVNQSSAQTNSQQNSNYFRDTQRPQRGSILIPVEQQNDAIEFASYQDNAVLSIAGKLYQLQKKIDFGATASVFEAKDLQTNKIVAIKLSPMAVNAPSDYSEKEWAKDIKTRTSEFTAYQAQLKSVQEELARVNLGGPHFLYFPIATDVLYLDGRYTGNYQYAGEKISFGAVVMPKADQNLKEKSLDLLHDNVFGDSPENARQYLSLTKALYDSIIGELAVLAEIGYGHFDLKPANIGFDETTGRFSLIDWEAIRRLVGVKYNRLPFHEGTPPFLPPEISPTTRFQFASTAYSFGVTLMSILDPNFMNYLAGLPTRMFTEEDLAERLEKIEESIKQSKDQGSLEVFHQLAKFIKAATFFNINQRREALAQLPLPKKLIMQLSKERSEAWVSGTLPNPAQEAPRPTYQEPPRMGKKVKAFIDKAVGYIQSVSGYQCIRLFN